MIAHCTLSTALAHPGMVGNVRDKWSTTLAEIMPGNALATVDWLARLPPDCNREDYHDQKAQAQTQKGHAMPTPAWPHKCGNGHDRTTRSYAGIDGRAGTARPATLASPSLPDPRGLAVDRRRDCIDHHSSRHGLLTHLAAPMRPIWQFRLTQLPTPCRVWTVRTIPWS